jgi:hypothetical protein
VKANDVEVREDACDDAGNQNSNRNDALTKTESDRERDGGMRQNRWHAQAF